MSKKKGKKFWFFDREQEMRVKERAGFRCVSKGGSMVETKQLPAVRQVSRVDLGLFSAMCDIYQGDPLDLDISECVKPLTLVLSPVGVVEIRKYQNYLLGRNPKGELKVTILHELPLELYMKIVGFFRSVTKLYSAEAICYPYYGVDLTLDPEKFYVDTHGDWKLVIPKQVVSGASVNAPRPEITEGAWGEIHSHNTMPAFFSGTDDASEKAEGFIYGVIGKLSDQNPEVKFRVRALGGWVLLDPVEKLDQRIPEPPKEWMDQVSGWSRGSGGYTYGGLTDEEIAAMGFERGAHGRLYASREYNKPKEQTDLRERLATNYRLPAATARSIPAYMTRIIRKDKSVWIRWSNMECCKTDLMESDLTPAEAVTALREGESWNEPSKSDSSDRARTSNID